MRKFSAPTLQDALIQASKELQCSVVDLHYEVIQQPRRGFLGMGKKKAIIVVSTSDSTRVSSKIPEHPRRDSLKDCMEIERELREMLSFMPYIIDEMRVEMHDKNVVKIYLDGKDTALLIGEKGYRYKALSYLLFSWIQPKYGYDIRLEVAQFLKIQEEIVEQYIQSIIPEINTATKYRTKNFSGILAVIALKRLREIYPGRYICLKNEQEEQFIVVSDFR